MIDAKRCAFSALLLKGTNVRAHHVVGYEMGTVLAANSCADYLLGWRSREGLSGGNFD